ncbi:MAG: hypothetical protein JO025_25060 [Verrucomicrobia bacterium]|nr:hypothetical protein [Verrucomicrobiota bacterium]
MPLRHVPNADPPFTYQLIAFDGQGNERPEPDGSLMSEKTLTAIRAGVSDIFVMSHGWLGDMDGALSQYDAWSKSLLSCRTDAEEIKRRRSGFKPLLIGMHWPSKPFGNEGMEGSFAASPAATNSGSTLEAAVQEWAERLGQSSEVQNELRTILSALTTMDDSEQLPKDVKDAYDRLDLAVGLGSAGESAPPGADRPEFNPQAIYEAARRDETADLESGSFASLSWSSLLAPLQILSFYRMKDRARNFGEGGAHRLLLNLQDAGKTGGTRIHLMGHSFGCIVVTGMAAGPTKDNSRRSPVQSMVLVQGAVSLWAYCDSMKYRPGTPGYFNRLIRSGRCEGPIVTTFSEFDKSVGRAYPLAAGLAQQQAFDVVELPRYGGIGAFGIQGLDTITTGREMGEPNTEYGFKAGQIYNLDAHAYISGNHGQYDAHCDIAHPEVAHVIWQAALPN